MNGLTIIGTLLSLRPASSAQSWCPATENNIQVTCKCDGEMITYCTLSAISHMDIDYLKATRFSPNFCFFPKLSTEVSSISISESPRLQSESVAEILAKYGRNLESLRLSNLFSQVEANKVLDMSRVR